MATTFQKRQKEMKRLEKARAKMERRAQKKLEPRVAGAGPEMSDEVVRAGDFGDDYEDVNAPLESEPRS
jgi:hypothetical protein